METSCVKQSDKPWYVTYVLRGAISKKYRQQHYYDTPKYIVHALRGAVSMTYRRLPERRNYRHRETFVAYAALSATRRYTFAATSSSTLLVFLIAPD